MRTEKLVMQITATILISLIVLMSQVIAASRTAELIGQAGKVDFSKAVPNQLNYQGYLADAADSSAVTATLEMTFRLYNAAVAGSEQWSETHPAVEVNNGLFQVILGNVTPFPAGLFDGSDLWLQTEVGPEALTPRKPLVSVAYSHRSNSAEMLEDNTLVDLDDRWVNEDQANSISSAMITDGEITDDDVSPTADIDPTKIADTAWTAGNDGAGSGLDADLLDGHQAIDFLSLSNDAGRSGVVTNLYEGTTVLSDKYVLKADLDHLNAADGDPANAVYVDAAGEVGIGTTAPEVNLHIYDDANEVIGINIENPNTGSGSIEMITFTDENGGVAGIATYDDGGAYPSAMRIFNNRPNGTIGLLTNGLERVRVNNDGKVGIGTSAPSYLLDVNGSMRATTYWGDGSHLTGIAGAPDADWTISGSDMYSGVSGNVGIGTAAPGYPLHVYHYAGYSPSYAGYFQAVGHEFTGNAYAVYADAQADDENAYGIYSTAASTWGRAYAGYFVGNIQADSLFLGTATKAGQYGGLLLYNSGAMDPVIELGDHYTSGGKINFFDMSGNWTTRIEPDIDGSGGFFEVERNNASPGFVVDGNAGATEEPWVSIEGSSQSVDFFMGSPGDGSVMLPTGAISAGEIMDEPGVSNDLGMGFFYLDAGNVNYTVDTLDITIPAPGYVEITAGCYLNLFHTNGTDTRIWLAIDKTAGNVNYTFPGAQIASVPSITPTTGWSFPCTSTRLYEETSAGTKRYYLNVKYHSGTDAITNVARSYLRATYYPTLYGSLTLVETDGLGDVLAVSQSPGDGTEPAVEPQRRTMTADDHNARLEAKLQALRAELETLKEEVQNQRR